MQEKNSYFDSSSFEMNRRAFIQNASFLAMHRAVADLKAKGINNAAALLGGFMAWQNAGLPVEAEEAVAPVAAPSPAPNQSPKPSPKQTPKQNSKEGL